MIAQFLDRYYVLTANREVKEISPTQISNVGFVIQDLLDGLDVRSLNLTYHSGRIHVTDNKTILVYDPLNGCWSQFLSRDKTKVTEIGLMTQAELEQLADDSTKPIKDRTKALDALGEFQKAYYPIRGISSKKTLVK